MLYEIHVTVDETQKVKVSGTDLKYVLVQNTKGSHPTQLIMTKWVSAKSAEDAIRAAQEFANELAQMGFKVLREKVEHELTANEFDLKLEQPHYTEFHIKIPTNLNRHDELFKLGERHNIAWSSIIEASKPSKPIPISTLRFKEGTVEHSLRCKDQWIQELTNAGFTWLGKMHQELCIYDSFIELDDGWS